MLKEKQITKKIYIDCCDICGEEISGCEFPFEITREKILGENKVSEKEKMNIFKKLMVGLSGNLWKKKVFKFHHKCVEQAVFEKMKKWKKNK